MATGKKRVYYHRLQTLLIEGGAYVVREVLDNLTGVPLTVHLQNNHARFSNPKSKTRGTSVTSQINLTQKQYDKLFSSPGNPSSVTSADLDITLLACLLQNTCDKLTNRKLKKGTDPVWYRTPADSSVEADIVRMRNFRNELSHRESSLISQQDFLSTWNNIETVLLRLCKSCTSNTRSLQTMIDDFKTGTIDEDAEGRNRQILEEWEEMDRCIQASLEAIHSDVIALKETLHTKDTPRLASLKAVSVCYFKRMYETKEDFVRTETYSKAVEKLNESGIAILSGYAGEGKTTMASQLLINLCPIEKILKLSNPKDMKEVNIKDWKGIFIDDILETTVLDVDRAKHWDSYLRDLVQYACDMKFYVVMTTRRNILTDAKERLELDILKDDYVIEVSSSYLSTEEKRNILMIHSKKNNRTISNLTLNFCFAKWKDDECKVGFPECAVMFASSDALFEKGPSFFATPFEFFLKLISKLKKNEDEFMILVFLWTSPTKTLSKFDIQPENSYHLKEVAKTLAYNLEGKSKTLIRVLQHHREGLLSPTDRINEYTFSHSVIGDVVGLTLGNDYLDLAIKYGTKSFIFKHVMTRDNTSTNNLCLDERMYSILGKRLNELIFQGGQISSGQDIKIPKINTCLEGIMNMRIAKDLPDISVLEHEVFNNEKFIEEYVSIAKRNNTLFKPVVDVFQHFRNPYCIDFGYGKMGIDVPIVLLARQNNTMIEECIKRDILTDRQKNISLLFATRNRDELLVRKLIEAGGQVNEDTLQIAVVNEDMPILKHLLHHFPNLNSTSSHIQKGNSPLITASKKGLLNVVECLVQSGIDINYRNKNGQSALDKAVICNDVAICEALIKKGCKLNVKAGKFHRTPLHSAVDMGYIDIVELLLKNEACIYTTDHRKEHPIHTAAIRGNIEIFRLLLEEDSSLAMNLFKFRGKYTTLYHYVVIEGKTSLLKLLIEKELDPNIQDFYGRTPLYIAVYYNKPELVEILIENSDVNLAENNGYTPLHAAVFKLNPEMVEMLCRYNADIRMVDRKGNSLFHVLKMVSNQQENLGDECGDSTRVRVSKCVKILFEKDREVQNYLELAKERIQNKKGEPVSVIFDKELYFVL